MIKILDCNLCRIMGFRGPDYDSDNSSYVTLSYDVILMSRGKFTAFVL